LNSRLLNMKSFAGYSLQKGKFLQEIIDEVAIRAQSPHGLGIKSRIDTRPGEASISSLRVG
uniref:DNA-directed RNA polymerase n=1 Tax=Haemonchus placei TaxID=6290 RepID=A0A0N4VTM6_HAEPC